MRSGKVTEDYEVATDTTRVTAGLLLEVLKLKARAKAIVKR
jgi:hypothetical protein